MYIASLDIGGTKTIAAILNEQGDILSKESFPSASASYEAHLELCVRIMERLMQKMDLNVEAFAGLGVSLPGIVDNQNGILLYAPFKNWENVPVAAYLSSRLGISRIRCENDVNACAIGELRFGLKKKYTDFIWMTVSTGVGGAVVVDKKLVRGGRGFAGELGHLKVEYEHPALCPCGQYGCLEAHGSGTAQNRETRRRADESPEFAKALKKRGLEPNGVGCDALAKEGNPEALEILDQIGTYLGRGISYCANVLDTQAIVMGGGVTTSLDLLLPSIYASVHNNTFRKMQNFDIVKTPLGYEAALIGAAALVLED